MIKILSKSIYTLLCNIFIRLNNVFSSLDIMCTNTLYLFRDTGKQSSRQGFQCSSKHWRWGQDDPMRQVCKDRQRMKIQRIIEVDIMYLKGSKFYSDLWEICRLLPRMSQVKCRKLL